MNPNPNPNPNNHQPAHLARDIPEPERLDYLTVVASLVAADHEVDDAELAALEALCQQLELSEPNRAIVLAAARAPDRATVDAILRRIEVGLRVSLLTDAIVIVFADGRVATAESKAIARLAQALELSMGQLGLIARYVESAVLGQAQPGDERTLCRELAVGMTTAEPGAPSPGAVRWLHSLFRRNRATPADQAR